MAVDSGTHLYVAAIDACPGSDPYSAQGTVSVVDTQTGSTLRSITVGRVPTSATIDPAGNRIYVTNWVDGTLSVIDTATNTVSQEITLGPNNFPLNSVINRAGTRLYVANNGSSTVSVIDTTTNQEAVSDIPVGNDASDLALTTDGTRLYVTNQGSNNVSVIDTATNLVLGAPIAVGSGPSSIAVTRSGPAVDLDQHGLTGSWYNPATGGQGFEIEVYPDLNGPGQGLLFAGWFTYDVTAAGGRRWYGLTGNVSKTSPTGALQIFAVEGGNLNAPPSLGANGALGRATIQFSDCNTGSLIYNFTDGSGRSGTIPLSRLTPSVTCSANGDNGNVASDYLLSGNWFNPNTSGQGLIFDFSPSINVVFAAWYTFMPHGQQIGGPASQQWFTLQSDQFIAGMTSLDNIPIVQTTGGAFDKPASTTSAQVGAAKIAFTSCNAMTLSYTFTAGDSAGLAGTINLQRVGPTPTGCSL
jgi:YVTN family beta-propeller protein